MHSYAVARFAAPPRDFFAWEHADWQPAGIIQAGAFRPESSQHRPVTMARFGHTGGTLYGLFQVHDRFVRSLQTQFQSHTHLDSCVEVFLQPRPDKGYFNFEFNCAGTLAVFYITDPTRTPNLFQSFQYLTPQDVQNLGVFPSLPGMVDPEIAEPITWTLGFAIPTGLFEPYVGELGELSGQTWRANIYKCGDATSQPHWAAWSPVQELNFHRPQDFGQFVFA